MADRSKPDHGSSNGVGECRNGNWLGPDPLRRFPISTIFNPAGVPTNPGTCCKLLPGGDPRTPDIIVLPNVGVVYTGNLKKQSEHGGFAWDDTNGHVAGSGPYFQAETIHSFVETTSGRSHHLKLLGYDPSDLDAVRMEGTPVLPGLNLGDGDKE